MEEADAIQFAAEIKEVKSYKASSGDMVYRLVVVSDNPQVNTLGLLNADTLVKLTVEVDHD